MAQLTTDQRAQVLQLIESGYISHTTAPQFLENLRNAPNAHDSIRQAMDNTMGDRWARDFAGVGRTVHGVGDAVSDFGKRFQEQGALGVGGNIISSIATTPFRAAGDVLGGNIQNPLQTTIGLASFLPVGQGVGSLARRALGKSVSRGGAWRAASGAVQLADIGTAENYLVDEILGEGMVAGAIGRGHSGQRRPDTKPSATPPPPGTPHAPGGFDIQPTPEQIRQINAQASASQNFNVPPFSPNLPALQGDRGVVPPAQPQPIRLETEPVPGPQGRTGSPPPRPAQLPPGTPASLPPPTAPQSPTLDQYRQFQEGIASLENRFRRRMKIGNRDFVFDYDPVRTEGYLRTEGQNLTTTDAYNVNRSKNPYDAEHMIGVFSDVTPQEQKSLYKKITSDGVLLSQDKTENLDSDTSEYEKIYFSTGPYYRMYGEGRIKAEGDIGFGVILDSKRMINDKVGRIHNVDTQTSVEGDQALKQARAPYRQRGTHGDRFVAANPEIVVDGSIDLSKYIIAVIEDGEVYSIRQRPTQQQAAPTPDQQQAPDTEKVKQKIATIRKRLDQQRRAFENASRQGASAETLDELQLEILGLVARLEALQEGQSQEQGQGGGGTTFYSDPFTASLVEGGKLVAGTFRWFANRIKSDYSIPTSPTGSVDPNIAKETIVNKGISPGMRAAYENVRRFFAAGMTDLKKMGLGDVANELEQKLQLDASRMANQWIQKIQPLYDQIDKLANTRFARTGKGKADIKSEIHELIWNYTERGANKVTITDPEIKAIAEPFREVWRELVAESNHLFFNDLPEYLRTNHNEEFYKLDANFQPIPYSPDAIDGFTFNPETQKFVNDSTGQEVVMERAFFESEGTYMPHNFPHEYWQQREKTVSGRIDRLSMSRANPNGSVPGFEFNKDNGQYTRQRDGAPFVDRTEAIDAEIAYQRQILKNVKRESEMSRPDIRDRVGSLERTRDTTETNYKRNLDLLPMHLMEIARRYHEIKMFGQRNPYTGELPRYEEYIARARDAVQSDREEEIKKIYDRLTPHHGFEQLGAIGYGQRQSSAALLSQMANIDVQKLKTDLPDLDVDLLTRIGFFREDSKARHSINEADAYRHFAWFNDARNKRANSMRSVLEGMTNWHWKNPTDSEYNKFWRTMSDVTTGLTLNPFTALRNITTEMPLLASMVGPGIMGKAIKQFLTDSDVRELAKMTHSGGLQATQYFTEGTQFGSAYLKAIGYTGSEAFVRNVGTVAGRLAAKKAISDYIANQSRANTAALDYLKIDKVKIDAYIQDHGKDTNRLNQMFTEVDNRTAEGVTPIGEAQKRVGTPQASNRHVDPFADEINRAGAYVSDTIFKPYNRLSQPQFLSSKNPVERTLFKFKSWIGQTMRLLRESAEKSVAQAKQGNYKPMFNLIASFTMMGIGGMATKTLFDALAGREDKEGFSALGFMDGLAAAGAMHLFSVVWEQVRYADGNTFKAYQSLLSFLSAPTVGVASQVGSQLLVGDIKGAAGEVARIAPITREAIRARGLLPQEQ